MHVRNCNRFGGSAKGLNQVEVVEGRSLTIRVRLQGRPPRDGNDPPASYAFLLAGVDPVMQHLFLFLNHVASVVLNSLLASPVR